MKKIFLVLAFSLAGYIAYADCYDEAFDAMEDAAANGLSEENIAAAGQLFYCQCANNCVWE